MRKDVVTVKRQSAKRPVWDFVNSAFGLFLLSSIALGIFSFSFNWYLEETKVQTARHDRINNIAAEIKFRMSYIEMLSKKTFYYTDLFSAHGALLGEEGNKRLDGAIIGEYAPIYADFGTRSLTSLLWELQNLVKKINPKADWTRAIESSRDLSRIWNQETKQIKDRFDGADDSTWCLKSADENLNLNEDVTKIVSILTEIKSSKST